MYDTNFLNNFDGIIYMLNRLKIVDTFNLIQNNIRPQIAIIMYHHIGSKKDGYLLNRTNTSDFEKQMISLKKTHEIINFERLISSFNEKKSLPKRAAIVTFDDGYKNNYTEAFPILKKHNIPATIFLTTGHIETDNIFWWDKIGYAINNTKLKKIELEEIGEIIPDSIKANFFALRSIFQKFKKIPEEKKKKLIDLLIKKSEVNIPKNFGKDIMMSWDNIREMNEDNIDFGSHTVTHPILTNLTMDQANFEIGSSKKEIERQINKPINSFCYPNGLSTDYNSEIIKILQNNGYICSVTALPKMVTKNSDLFELGRLPPGYDLKSFKFSISGLYSILNKFSR